MSSPQPTIIVIPKPSGASQVFVSGDQNGGGGTTEIATAQSVAMAIQSVASGSVSSVPQPASSGDHRVPFNDNGVIGYDEGFNYDKEAGLLRVPRIETRSVNARTFSGDLGVTIGTSGASMMALFNVDDSVIAGYDLATGEYVYAGGQLKFVANAAIFTTPGSFTTQTYGSPSLILGNTAIGGLFGIIVHDENPDDAGLVAQRRSLALVGDNLFLKVDEGDNDWKKLHRDGADEYVFGNFGQAEFSQQDGYTLLIRRVNETASALAGSGVLISGGMIGNNDPEVTIFDEYGNPSAQMKSSTFVLGRDGESQATISKDNGRYYLSLLDDAGSPSVKIRAANVSSSEEATILLPRLSDGELGVSISGDGSALFSNTVEVRTDEQTVNPFQLYSVELGSVIRFWIVDTALNNSHNGSVGSLGWSNGTLYIKQALGNSGWKRVHHDNAPVNATAYKIGGIDGVSGAFFTNDGKIVTVTNGIITSIELD